MWKKNKEKKYYYVICYINYCTDNVTILFLASDAHSDMLTINDNFFAAYTVLLHSEQIKNWLLVR